MRPILADLVGAAVASRAQGRRGKGGRGQRERAGRRGGQPTVRAEADARSRKDRGRTVCLTEASPPQEQLSAPRERGNLVQLSCPLRPELAPRAGASCGLTPRKGGRGATRRRLSHAVGGSKEGHEAYGVATAKLSEGGSRGREGEGGDGRVCEVSKRARERERERRKRAAECAHTNTRGCDSQVGEASKRKVQREREEGRSGAGWAEVCAREARGSRVRAWTTRAAACRLRLARPPPPLPLFLVSSVT